MGHSGENRLLTFARKPAPISATYLGYPNTTGLTSIDYRLTDHYADPEGMTESFHSEKLVRLPQSFLCYRPFEDSPPLQPPPVTREGYITFGSFNNYAKLNPPLLRLWAQILQAVEKSKLMIKLKSLTDRGTRQRLEAQMAQLGISPDRLILIGYTRTTLEHLSIYHDVDIALDSFPYCGTTTTCEALWMGVPVVTLVGKVHASRVGLSILSNVGLTEWITHTPEDYVKTCIRLAQEIDYLQTFRNTIRTHLQRSPLLDAVSRTCDLETVYHQWSGK
jgi:predicted O-linked N-acetylglucosamine transferase (SPINDLY family)